MKKTCAITLCLFLTAASGFCEDWEFMVIRDSSGLQWWPRRADGSTDFPPPSGFVERQRPLPEEPERQGLTKCKKGCIVLVWEKNSRYQHGYS